MSNWDVNIEILIRKYTSGTLSNSEAVYLAEWVKSSKHNAERFRTTVRAIEQSESQRTAQAENFSKRVINKAFKKEAPRKVTLLPQLKNRWQIAAISSMVAVVAIVLGFSISYNNANNAEQLVAESSPIESLVSTLEYCAPKDAPLHIALVDGTQITLNQNSRLTLSADYNATARNVTLDGEAYFDVAKSDKRFTVTAGDNSYIVHGTSFNINSYAEDKLAIVTLHTGKLEAKIDAQSYMLKPGDELRVDDKVKSVSKHVVNTENSISWMNKKLTFSRLPLKFVIKQIEHKYNVKINMHSDIEDIPYTGELQNEDLKSALHLLSITAPISLAVTESNNEFYITKM